MYNINSVQHSYNTQVNKTSPLRNAAISPNPPKLTSDESSLIKEKFTPSKQMKLYTGDGNTQSTGFERGLNLDTRI